MSTVYSGGPVAGRASPPGPAEDARWSSFVRFLILGDVGGGYRAFGRTVSAASRAIVRRCVAEDPALVVAKVVEVALSGVAPHDDALAYALAVVNADADEAGRRAAAGALPVVCRTGAQLLRFVAEAASLRGWGAGLREAVAGWYNGQDADQLVDRVLRHPRAGGWSHKDAIQMAHPAPPDDAHGAAYRWITRRAGGLGELVVKGKPYPDVRRSLPPLAAAADRLRDADPARAASLIREESLPIAAVPQRLLDEPRVWEALLPHAPLEDTIRHLGRMTSVGLLDPPSDAERLIVGRLHDRGLIAGSGLGPMAVLSALAGYRLGRSAGPGRPWTPIPRMVDALDGAFYLAFDTIEPGRARTLLAMDVSGSPAPPAGLGPGLTAREAAAVMAMTAARVEPECRVMTFAGPRRLAPVALTAADTLGEAVAKLARPACGSPDCAAPVAAASASRWDVDVFGVYTDGRPAIGPTPPGAALASYRRYSGIGSRMYVCGLSRREFRLADPADPGQMDLVGIDLAAPRLIADFSSGRV